MHAIETLATFAACLSPKDIPEDVRRTAVNCIIDTLGVALGGAERPIVARMHGIAEKAYAPGPCFTVGGPMRLSPQGAALVNGTAAHALDFDDNCYAGFVHGSAVVLPAALAASQAGNATGEELITAFVAGAEIEFAIGAAATPNLYEKGWWTTGVLGPMGACVAAAKLMGGDAEIIANALGLAVVSAGGSKACFGTDGKPALCGRAAETGVVAALMALSGMTGPRDAFENGRGFAALLNDRIFERALLDRGGEDWLMRSPGVDIKRVPVCLSAHTAIDAVMDIIAEHGLDRASIKSVRCDVGPVVRGNLVYDAPETPQQAQFSLRFCVGVVLEHGDVSLACLTPDVIGSPRMKAAMSRVEVVTGPRWSDSEFARRYPEGTHVSIALEDGRSFERFNGMARGTTARPLSEGEIDQKFLTCASSALGPAAAGRLLARLRAIAAATSLRDLVPEVA